MQLLYKSKDIDAAFVELLRRYRSISFAVAWAGEGFQGYKDLLRNQKKIKAGVVGLHFFQTHPNFIKNFMRSKAVSFVKLSNGVFHPKIFLFENSKADWACLVGSANFTRGGFVSNDEACVQFDHSDKDAVKMRAKLDEALKYFFRHAGAFDPDELDNYKVIYKKSRNSLFPLSSAAVTRSRKRESNAGPVASMLNVPIVNMSWANFYRKVLNDKHHRVGERIIVLEEAKKRFWKFEKFSLMPSDDRRGIAGFGPEGDIPWGWFGSMKPAGIFKKRVVSNDKNLSRALDAIPLVGDVSEDQYWEFIDSYRKAFPSGLGHGLATASRLLAMKRPDYFVCFDSANRDRLCKAFGVVLGRHHYERYWKFIIGPILMSPWWNSPRPQSEKQLAVWEGRAAFLDSHFYVPKKVDDCGSP